MDLQEKLKTLVLILALASAFTAIASCNGNDASVNAAQGGSHISVDTDLLQKSDFLVFGEDWDTWQSQGFKPRADVPAVRLELPLDWSMDPLDDVNWQFNLDAWRMLNPIWSRWYGQDWEQLHAHVMPWVLDWYHYHVVDSKHSAYEWHDMATGLRAQSIALLFLLHERRQMPLDADELAALEVLARLHVQTLAEPGFIRTNNHAFFMIHGLRLLCIVWNGPACAGMDAYTSERFQALLRAQFDEHGAHTENSPFYHRMMTERFSNVQPELYPGVADELRTTVARAQAVLPWFTLPNGDIAPVGDSEGRGVEFKVPTDATCSSLDTQGRCIYMRDLARSGYVVARTAPDLPAESASMLFVMGMTRSNGHNHADALSFVLWEGGPLFVDSEKYTFDRGPWRDYFVSVEAHNTVGLDGLNFGPKQTITKYSALTDARCSSNNCVIEGRVERKHEKASLWHSRALSYVPGQSLEVQDQVRTIPSAAWNVYWHLATDLDAAVNGSDVSITRSNQVIARLAANELACQPKTVRGATDPIQGWVSTSYRHKEENTVIVYQCPGHIVRLTSTVTLLP